MGASEAEVEEVRGLLMRVCACVAAEEYADASAEMEVVRGRQWSECLCVRAAVEAKECVCAWAEVVEDKCANACELSVSQRVK